MRLCFEVPSQPRSGSYRFGDFQKVLWPHASGGNTPRWLYAPKGKVLFWTDGQEDDFNRVCNKLLREQDKYGAINVVALPDEVDEAALVAASSESVIDFSQVLTEAQRMLLGDWLRKEYGDPAAPFPAPAPAPSVLSAPAGAPPQGAAALAADGGSSPAPKPEATKVDAGSSTSTSTSKKAAAKSKSKSKKKPAPTKEPPASTPTPPPQPGGTL